MGLFRRLAILDSRTKAPLEEVVIDRLAEVTNRPIVQGAVPNNLIRVCRNEDRRDRVACIVVCFVACHDVERRVCWKHSPPRFQLKALAGEQ